MAEHLAALSRIVLPHWEFIRDLQRTASVAIAIAYATNVDHGGLVIPHTALELFTRLRLDIKVYVTTMAKD